MSIQLADNLNIRGNKSDFERQEFSTLEDMKNCNLSYYPAVYTAVCEATGKLYILNKSNDDDATLGKWREVSDSVNISSEEGNALTKKDDGLYVSASAVEISEAAGNTLTEKDDGLYAKPAVSAEEDNAIVEKTDGLYVANVQETEISEAEGNIIVKKDDGIYAPETDISGKVDKEEGKGLSANDFTNELKAKLDGIEEEANKTVVDESLSATSENPVQNKVIKNLMGKADGFATLDSNGKLPSDQIPTSARQIKGQFDASATHTLPDISDYNTGDELLVVGAGYYTQSTAFTLTAGNTLTDMEVAQANALIAASYVFTLKSGDTTLGTVKTFATDKVTLSDDTEIALPYASDLSATSEPSEVQVTAAVGDEIINIDSHWIKLSNTSNVTSVNEKTGAVVLSADDVGAVNTDNVVAEFSETTSDSKVPSEKLVKDSLDEKVAVNQGTENAGKGLLVGDDGLVKTGTVSSGWNGTQAEWDALSVAEREEYDGQLVSITDDFDEINATSSYSTSETFTGQYWIDGKKIYRKVIETTAPVCKTQGTEVSKSINIDNLKYAITLRGAFHNSSTETYFPVPICTPSLNGQIRMSFAEGMIYLSNSSTSWSSLDVVIIIEYTKTTD